MHSTRKERSHPDRRSGKSSRKLERTTSDRSLRTGAPKIRVLIVDDFALVRAGLRMLIGSQRQMTVVGEARNADEAIDKVKETKPDVVLMDLTMPGSAEQDPVRLLLRACPGARVLVLTMHDDPVHARSALGAGAAGYVVKTAEASELLAAIRAVREGRTFVDANLAGSMAIVKRKPFAVERGSASRLALLSVREREVFDLLVRGQTNKQIAATIGVSVKTVETFRSRVSSKLGLKRRSDFMRFAEESGLLTHGKGPAEES